MSQFQLEGRKLLDVIEGDDAEIKRLRQRVESLTIELRAAKDEARELEAENRNLLVGIRQLRSVLSPLYQGLRSVFGELDSMTVPESSPSDPRNLRALWQEWIDKFGADTLNAKMITALLNHGPLTAEQLRVPMKCSAQSVYNTRDRLQKLGLVNTSGGKYALKEL